MHTDNFLKETWLNPCPAIYRACFIAYFQSPTLRHSLGFNNYL